MNRLRVAVGGVVTAVWAVGYLLSYADPSIKAPAEATPIMLGVVAYLFARELKGKLNGGTKNE